jgi:YVTN family beta-propeller protein
MDAKQFKLMGTFTVGKAPNHLAFVQNVKGRFVYVTIAKDNAVEVYEQEGGHKPVAKIAVGEEPHGIWPNEDGSRLYVGHEKTNDVRVIDTAANTVIATYAVGKKPIDVIYLP